MKGGEGTGPRNATTNQIQEYTRRGARQARKDLRLMCRRVNVYRFTAGATARIGVAA